MWLASHQRGLSRRSLRKGGGLAIVANEMKTYNDHPFRVMGMNIGHKPVQNWKYSYPSAHHQFAIKTASSPTGKFRLISSNFD